MYQKYRNSVPLYRQEADWEHLRVKIPRATLANWTSNAAWIIWGRYDLLHRHLLERDIIHADETPCQVLKEYGKTVQSKSYMWLYGSGNDGLPPILADIKRNCLDHARPCPFAVGFSVPRYRGGSPVQFHYLQPGRDCKVE